MRWRCCSTTCHLRSSTGSLCDALTGGSDGEQLLERLERDNLFLFPLDDQRHWYRYHHLFADALRARLQAENPDRVPTVHRAAAAGTPSTERWPTPSATLWPQPMSSRRPTSWNSRCQKPGSAGRTGSCVTG